MKRLNGDRHSIVYGLKAAIDKRFGVNCAAENRNIEYLTARAMLVEAIYIVFHNLDLNITQTEIGTVIKQNRATLVNTRKKFRELVTSNDLDFWQKLVNKFSNKPLTFSDALLIHDENKQDYILAKRRLLEQIAATIISDRTSISTARINEIAKDISENYLNKTII